MSKETSTISKMDITESCDNHGQQCITHPQRELELFCNDCRTVICSLCRETVHRRCISVVTLVEASSLLTPRLEEKEMEISTNLQTLKMLLQNKKNDLNQLNADFAKLDGDVDKASQAVVAVVQSKAMSLKKEINDLKVQQAEKLGFLVRTIETDVEILEKNQMILTEAKGSKSLAEKVQVIENMKIPDQTSMPDVVEKVQFESCEEKVKASISDQELGRVFVQQRNMVDVRRGTLTFQRKIDIQVPEDKEPSFLRDVLATNLSGMDVIVIADSENKCIKSFFDKSKHSYLRLRAGPCKMTKVAHTQGAITLSNKSILIFEFNPVLTATTSISTRKKYYGIAWLGNSTFAVGGLSPVCVDIVDMKGKILKSLSHFVQDELVFWNFQTPVFLCAMPSGHIVVSDYSTRQVTVLTRDLDIEYRFPRLLPQEEGTLRNNLGVACATNDDIFVVDRTREAVIQLDSHAKFVRNVLTSKDRLEGTTCIFVDEEDRLFLAVANNTVRMFTFVSSKGQV